MRRDGTGVMETGAHDMGQGAWTALAQIAADGLGLDLDRVEFRSGTSDLPDAGIAGGSAHTATAGMAIHNAGADVIAKLADLATGDERSPLFGAGNAGVVARDGRLFRRDDETPQRELCRHPRARRPGRDRGDAATAPPIPRRNRTTPCTRMARCSPRSRSIRISARSASPAWSAPSPAGRIINPRMVRSQLLRRHDLGRLVRAARAGRDGPALRADHECRTLPSTTSR